MSHLPPQVADRASVKVCAPECEVHGGCENAGKRPVPSVYDVVSAESAREWVRAGGNVGVACADSLVVVDIDDPGRVVPLVGDVFGVETFTVRTPGGGFHVYFECDAWGQNRSWAAGGDELASVRATAGRLVVAPPSRHPSGGRYRVFVDAQVATVEPDAIRRFCAGVDALEAAVSGGSEPPLSTAENADPGGGERSEPPPGVGERSEPHADGLDGLVHHDEYRAKCRRILADSEAPHDSRVWLAGFLGGSVGLSVSEICRVIRCGNNWRNYDPGVTRRQVESVVGSSGGGR